MGDGIIFGIRFTSRHPKKNLKHLEGFDTDYTMRGAERVGNKLLARVADVLEPISVTGETKRSIEVSFSEHNDHLFLSLQETTPVGEYIRRGLQPFEDVPSYDTILKWVAMRHIKLVHWDELMEYSKSTEYGFNPELNRAVVDKYSYKMNGKEIKVVRSRFAKVGQKTQIYTPSEITHSAINAIKGALTTKGTMARGYWPKLFNPHWYRFYPKGKGRFDYPVVAFGRDYAWVKRNISVKDFYGDRRYAGSRFIEIFVQSMSKRGGRLESVFEIT